MSLRRLKTEKKKQEIIQSAISIIAEKGFHATSTEEIATNLLMTKGSLYYYFKDKQDLLFQSQVMIMEKSIANITEQSREKISKLPYNLFSIMDNKYD